MGYISSRSIDIFEAKNIRSGRSSVAVPLLKSQISLYRLCEGNTVDDLLLTLDQIQLRWLSYHLKAGVGSEGSVPFVINNAPPDPTFPVNNFSRDVSDSENYTMLFKQPKPDECSCAHL